MITRGQWNARKPSTPIPEIGIVDTVFIHHSVTMPTSDPKYDVRKIQDFHMDGRHYADIAYTLLVHPDGTVLEGRTKGLKAGQGAHTSGYNWKSIAICAIGNYEINQVPQKLLEGINEALRIAISNGWVINDPKIRSHSEVGRTACCGRNLRELIPSLNGQPSNPPSQPIGVIVTQSGVFSNVQANKLDGNGNGYTDVPHSEGKDPLFMVATIENGFNSETKKYPSHRPLLFCSALDNNKVRVTIVGGAPEGKYTFDLRCDW